MNDQVKRDWCKALRSGEFKQTKNVLAHDGKYCCLGVLGKITGTLSEEDLRLNHGYWKFELSLGLSETDRIACAQFNDSGRSFEFIADWIEGNL